MLQLLKHPNFVELVEIYQGESSYYIITELLEGDTLYKFIKGYPAEMLPVKMIRQIMKVLISSNSSS
jgi:cell cycle serine/threonine-protein kinase CDC5/MSD2/calcium/calmodulin-dependent protein kinase I